MDKLFTKKSRESTLHFFIFLVPTEYPYQNVQIQSDQNKNFQKVLTIRLCSQSVITFWTSIVQLQKF